MDALRLGPLAVPFGPLILVLGYGVATIVAARLRKAGRGDAEPALLPLLALALVAARASFVLRHAADYPGIVAMLDVRDRAIDPWAGWIVAALGTAFWAWRRPALRRSLPASAAAGAAVVLAASGLLALLQPSLPPLPDLTLQRLDGRPLALRDLRGRPLVVNLWATWCPPCRHELPTLVQAARQRNGVGIVLIDEGEPASRVAEFLRREGLAPPLVALDPSGALLARYRSPGLPTTLFVAADGTVQWVHVGELSAATLQQGIARLRGN